MEHRPAVPADAAAITDHHHRCWVSAFTHLLPEGAIDGLRSEVMLETWHGRLASGSGHSTVVAVDAGRVVGHTSVRRNEIVTLYVHPDEQGRGIGRRLLGVAEGIVSDAGHDEAELRTVVGNDPAIGLYRSAGWTVTEEIVRSEDYGMTYDEQVLRKRLR
ncbi:MAG: GNAT family N-acetyltransferase [Actinomycetota bacterium]